MTILVRNEKFGQIVFQRSTRKHQFILSENPVEQELNEEQKQFFCRELGVEYNSKNTIFIVKGIDYQKHVKIQNRLSAPLCL